MVELENGRRVCEVCRKERFRFEFDEEFRTYTGGEDICVNCICLFVADCLDAWRRKQEQDNEVIGGYRRAELAYHSEEMYGGPRYCDRCGDEGFGGEGHLGFVGFPGGARMTLCYTCSDNWYAAADVGEDGHSDFMTPAAVAAFQWKVESQRAVADRKHKERREVWKQQGGLCGLRHCC